VGPASTDDELMARIQAGSHDAFAELYDRYCDRAYRVARSLSPDDAAAEEAVEEAFAVIWKSRQTYRPVRPTAAAWLLTVVGQRATDAGRRNADVERRADGNRLRGLLTRLPDAEREVVALAFYGELTHTAIAEQLDLPVGTVKDRMRLGLHELLASHSSQFSSDH
jgi:RNA polymerase sigma-70 factor (ECF subfamily)